MTIREYAQYALDQEARCWNCRGEVHLEDMRHYEHDGGWDVDGFPERQWLYFECSNGTCRYQTSFAALGIKRPYPQETLLH